MISLRVVSEDGEEGSTKHPPEGLSSHNSGTILLLLPPQAKRELDDNAITSFRLYS